MTTVINNPGGTTDEGAGLGLLVGVLLTIAVLVLFFVYGLPAIRGNNAPANDNGSIDVNVKLPADNNSGTGGSGSTGGSTTGGTGSGY